MRLLRVITLPLSIRARGVRICKSECMYVFIDIMILHILCPLLFMTDTRGILVFPSFRKFVSDMSFFFGTNILKGWIFLRICKADLTHSSIHEENIDLMQSSFHGTKGRKYLEFFKGWSRANTHSPPTPLTLTSCETFHNRVYAGKFRSPIRISTTRYAVATKRIIDSKPLQFIWFRN